MIMNAQLFVWWREGRKHCRVESIVIMLSILLYIRNRMNCIILCWATLKETILAMSSSIPLMSNMSLGSLK
jgi:hypothetical protein